MYPYSFEEYRGEVFKQIKDLEIHLDIDEIEEIIENDYNGKKYLHESGISNALNKIQYEVSSTISCLLMF